MTVVGIVVVNGAGRVFVGHPWLEEENKTCAARSQCASSSLLLVRCCCCRCCCLTSCVLELLEVLLERLEIPFVDSALFRLVVEEVRVYVEQKRSVHHLPLLGRQHAHCLGAACSSRAVSDDRAAST